MTDRFDVVLTGLVHGQDPTSAVQALSRGFSTPPDKVERALLQAPVPIRRNVTRAIATVCERIIHDAGATCEVRPSADAGPAARTDPPPPRTAASRPSRVEGAERSGGPSRLLLLAGAGLSLLLIVGTVVFVAVNNPNRDDTPTSTSEHISRVDPVEDPAEQANDGETEEELRLGPGEQRAFSITARLPLLHTNDILPSVEVSYKVVRNEWSSLGVEAKVLHAAVDGSRVDLWEACKGPGECFLPTFGDDLKAEQAAQGGGDLSKLLKGTVDGFVGLASSTESEFKERAGGTDITSARKRTYSIYKAKLSLSIAIPSRKEFEGDSEFWRAGTIELGIELLRVRGLTVSVSRADGTGSDMGADIAIGIEHFLPVRLTKTLGRSGMAVAPQGGFELAREGG